MKGKQTRTNSGLKNSPMNRKWQYKRIGDVCTVERGGSPRPIDKFITDDENGINWIKIGDTSDSMFITETAQKIIPEGMKKSRYVQPGDFLLSNSMSFGRPYILKIDGCIHDGWLVLRDDDNVFDKRFLYYYLSSKSTYQKFKSMAVGGVVNNLNSEMVRKVSVPIPSVSEQQTIADTLDKLQSIITHRKQQLEKLDELVKARFVEMFGDSETNSNNHPVYKLCDLCTVSSSKRIYQEEQSGSGVPFLRISNLVDLIDNNRFGSELFIPEEKYNELLENGLVPKTDDILVTSRGTLGKCYIIQEHDKFYFQDGMISWLYNIDKSITPLYLTLLFDTRDIKRQIENLQSGSTVAYLSIAMLKKLNIVVPPHELQEQFAAFVEQTDKSKVAVQKALDEAQVLFNSLMQEYFG